MQDKWKQGAASGRSDDWQARGQTGAATSDAETTVAIAEVSFAGAWVDVTSGAIGVTGEWTNKVELADVNGDGHVDVLFANGGNSDSPGTPVLSRVFLNNGEGMFADVSEDVLGAAVLLTRVIKVHDVNRDGYTDILLGTTFQTQSRPLLGVGDGSFADVTESQLPAMPLSAGDLEVGDVDADGDLDIVVADSRAGSPLSNDEPRCPNRRVLERVTGRRQGHPGSAVSPARDR